MQRHKSTLRLDFLKSERCLASSFIKWFTWFLIQLSGNVECLWEVGCWLDSAPRCTVEREEGLSLSKGWSTNIDTLKPSQTQYRFNQLAPDLLKTLMCCYIKFNEFIPQIKSMND